MKQAEGKISTFTDLDAWQEGHKLVLQIYKTTQSFPREELFSLTSQIRRAAISITANVAEGFGRRGYKSKNYFYSVAQGSVTELQNGLIIARDIGFITSIDYESLSAQSIKVHKIITGLIKSLLPPT